MLHALRGQCQNKTLQQIDTTLGRSQPIALGPGRTFVQRKSLMSVVTWPEVAVFANDRRYGVGARRWASEWRDGITSDACKALDCEAAIVQSKLSVDYGELDTCWRAVLIYPNCIAAIPWLRRVQLAEILFASEVQRSVLFTSSHIVVACLRYDISLAKCPCCHPWQRNDHVTMSVARLLCSPPVLTTKAVLHPAVLPGCEEQFDWLLVTLKV